MLRPISEKDSGNILKWRNDPEVRSSFVFQDELTIETHKNWLNDHVTSGKAVQFIIVTEDLGDIGSVYLRDVDHKNQKAEFGIFIGEKSARGKGFGTEATRLILEYAFCKLNLNKVYLRVFPDNIGAIKSYKRAGFTQEGYFADDVIINSKPCDMIFMAILRSHFIEGK